MKRIMDSWQKTLCVIKMLFLQCVYSQKFVHTKDQGKTLYDLLMENLPRIWLSYEYTVNVVRPGKTEAMR